MTDYTTGTFFIKPNRQGIDDFQDMLDQDYEIAISNWISTGWQIFKKNAALSIAFAVVAGITISLLTSIIPGSGLLVQFPVLAGFIVASLLFFKNENAEFKDYLCGFRHFLPLLVFTIVSTIFIFIGFLLLIVPGIYLSIAYLFAPFLIVDKNIDFWPAMELSRKMINKHFPGMFGFAVVVSLIVLAGCIPVFLGLFITIPLAMSIMTAAYVDIFRKASVGSGSESPSDPVQA